jgi:hypothetical protein
VVPGHIRGARPPDVPFRWLGNSLRDYALEWRSPAELDHAGVRRQGTLYVRFGDHDRPEWVVTGEVRPRPLHSEPTMSVILRVGEEEYRSTYRQDGLDEALGDLRRNLPADLRPLMCHSCGLAEYSNYGTGGVFGFLACCRDTPDEIRAVARGGDFKRMLDALWPSQAGFVGETYLCSQHEPGGSRNTPLSSGRLAGDWTPRV